MSDFSTALFRWVQSASYYVEIHRSAVALLALGEGKRWLDVGCGPGLVPRLAAQRGYRAQGIDRNADMIAAARAIAERHASKAEYAVADLGSTHTEKAFDAVSATSLLFVLADPLAGLRTLWSRVRPGGFLLVVETTSAMQPGNAWRYWRRHGSGWRESSLLLWAHARRGRSVDASLFSSVEAQSRTVVPLLDGMVAAHLLRKA